MARNLWPLIACALFVMIIAGADSTARADDSRTFSDNSLDGTYLVSTTLKAYVKFGGPRISAGEIRFDGRGNLEGETTFFDEPLKLHGTYHIESDGTGTATYAATSSSGHTDYVELRLRIVNPDKLEFQSPGWENRDWSSVQTQMQSGHAGLIGEMRRKSDQPAR